MSLLLKDETSPEGSAHLRDDDAQGLVLAHPPGKSPLAGGPVSVRDPGLHFKRSQNAQDISVKREQLINQRLFACLAKNDDDDDNDDDKTTPRPSSTESRPLKLTQINFISFFSTM